MRLLIVDTVGIQPYIFGSNRLRENIGASHLVAQATGEWAFDTLPESHNVKGVTTGEIDDDKHIECERDNLDAEVLYAAGGNVVVLFRDETTAKNFTRELSRKVLIDAPNLQLVIVQKEFDWNHKPLSQAVEELFEELASRKRSRMQAAPLLGLGVTVACRSTGLPAVRFTDSIGGDPGYPASEEIHAKIAAATKRGGKSSQADERLHRHLPHPQGYGYPSQFDHLGGTRGQQNYLAVVHADGNGMGQRIIDIGNEFQQQVQNRDYITTLRKFSQAVEQAAQAALKGTLAKLSCCIESGYKLPHPSLEDVYVSLASDEAGQPLLPFRPIVFGGDDVTFVCDGRLGLSLATSYLERFQEETQKRVDCRGPITASAGVAVVRTHYPFAQAYELADQLCRSAKSYRQEIKGKSSDDACLDWHFALGGITGDIKLIREREYTTRNGTKDETKLYLRPVTLGTNSHRASRSWQVVRSGVEAFQNPAWVERRNKMKALRDVLREGKSAVERFLTMFNAGRPLPDLPPLVSMPDHKTKGHVGNRCTYFDALEIADWFIPLEKGEDR